MKRWALNPIVWVVDLAATFVGAAIDAAYEHFTLDGDDEWCPTCGAHPSLRSDVDQ